MIWPLIQPHTCEMVSSVFVAIIWLKFVSTSRASFLNTPFTDSTNGEKIFRWLWQWLPWLSLFYFSQRARSLFIGSCFQVSVSKSQNLTSIMVSLWFPRYPLMRTSHLVSSLPFPWCNTSSDMMHLWWTRGFPLVKQGLGSFHTLCYGVQWRGLSYCS